ncbi:MAG: cell division protein ZapA [Clostridia bacterium]|nr:cell division protein ZapA [Clostridia bacterium]MBQ8469780.1 cell division protein ZapA [Clostridia bacterium]MBR1704025.1 cell division protein ZapA [Clostridia bacterium]
MEKQNVVINIAGSDYTIITEEEPAYVEALAEALDKDIMEIVAANRRLSMTQAAILVALDYADKAAKESESADNMRNQIKEYLEDSARYKMEAEVARRDVERLQKELKNAKSQSF